ncbi:Uncharacterised protein [Enterobacter cloacae]|nr:Uncharacterised protein [Enterobacter cloacae]
MSRFIILRSGLKSLIGPGMVFMLSVSPAMAYTDRNDIEFHVTGRPREILLERLCRSGGEHRKCASDHRV